MKNLLSIVFLLFTSFIIAQDLDAPTITYVSFAPCITNEPGNFATKFSPTIEVGRQFNDIFTIGLAVGKTNLNRVISVPNSSYNFNTKIGTANKLGDDLYLEVRPNLNVFQVGKFVNTFTTGIGYVFGPTPSLMLEFTSGVEYSYSDSLHINIFYGNYYYSTFAPTPTMNVPSDDNVQGAPEHFSPTFIGVSFVKFLKPSKAKGLVKLN